MVPRAFKLHPADNVATLLDDAAPGPVQIVGADTQTLALTAAVSLGHKIALTEIPNGAPITKFAVPIGHASVAIHPGDWVHLHNCASNFDQRSQTLDLHTGAATDTRYE